MAGDFSIYLMPVGPTQDSANEGPLEFFGVDIGFNQLGWLVVTNENREPIAMFTPGTVQYVISQAQENVIEIVAEPVEQELIN